MRIPMGTNVKLIKDKNGSSVDPTLYRNIISNLLYLIASHPDICHSIEVCVKYQANPKEPYLAMVKRIILYVNGTIGFGI